MSTAKLNQAKIFLDNANFNKALEVYRNIISSEPQNAVAYQYASVALANLGSYPDALNMSIKALEIDPMLVIPHTTMAIIYDELGEKEKSRQEAKIALDKNQESPDALCCSGILSLIDNRLDDAMQYLEKLSKLIHRFIWHTITLLLYTKAKKMQESSSDKQ